MPSDARHASVSKICYKAQTRTVRPIVSVIRGPIASGGVNYPLSDSG